MIETVSTSQFEDRTITAVVRETVEHPETIVRNDPADGDDGVTSGENGWGDEATATAEREDTGVEKPAAGAETPSK